MLTFYNQNTDEFAGWVAQKLDEMVVAHRFIMADAKTKLPNDLTANDLPILWDGHEVWKSENEIREFLEELHQDLILSRGMQSDACHLDPDNPKECL